ncbi:MAG: hypothetical protein EP330_18640 [Deltaproteobacteria bacterium]|nr:MAG: hypothetical protein EP330_18640 [Deltaproteobacteria bacterium]
MDLFDSPAELERQLKEAKGELDMLDEGGDSAILLARLRERKPNHPLLWSKTMFALGCLSGIVVGGFIVAAPMIDPDLITELRAYEKSLGLAPAALAFGVAGASAVLWIVTSVLTLLVARGEEPLEWEGKERARITSDIARIKAAMQLHERNEVGTPLGAAPRGGKPTGGAPPISMLGSATPPPLPGMRTATPAPAPSAASQGSSLLQSLGTKTRGGTPLGAAPRGGTPIGGRPLAAAPSGNMSYSGPADSGFADFDDDGDFPNFDALGQTQSQGPTYAQARDDVRPELVGLGAGFTKPTATVFPNWGPVEEPWLVDAIEKCYALAQDLPLQASVAFNQGQNLPFTLVLERASPAIAMRATMAYAEFLAKIATPVRARVDLAAVPHLSSNFARNVTSALEPHFGEDAEVERKGDAIEIRFRNANTSWNRYPMLPTQ